MLCSENFREPAQHVPLSKELKEDKFLRRITTKLHHLSAVLGNKNWISGKKVNYPDFNLYDLLDMLRTLSPEILAIHFNLENFMLRFEGLNHVKAYIRSNEFIQRPFFHPRAAWNSSKS
nr:hypothetical transcript [Hymenolepis microstoma]